MRAPLVTSSRHFLSPPLLVTSLALTVTTAAPVHADVIDTRGMAPHEQCAYCHGLDGNSLMPRFPRLAGQSVDYLRKQLADFKHGRRTNDEGAMSGIADALADADIEAIVRHYSAQTPKSPSAPAADVTAGRQLYLKGRSGIAACASCHGTGAPTVADAPRLAGQHGEYIAKQLQDFRRGARRNDADGVMRRIAQMLRESDVRAVAAFLATQPVMTGASR